MVLFGQYIPDYTRLSSKCKTYNETECYMYADKLCSYGYYSVSKSKSAYFCRSLDAKFFAGVIVAIVFMGLCYAYSMMFLIFGRMTGRFKDYKRLAPFDLVSCVFGLVFSCLFFKRDNTNGVAETLIILSCLHVLLLLVLFCWRNTF